MVEGADCFIADTNLVRTLEVLLTDTEIERCRGHLQVGSVNRFLMALTPSATRTTFAIVD